MELPWPWVLHPPALAQRLVARAYGLVGVTVERWGLGCPSAQFTREKQSGFCCPVESEVWPGKENGADQSDGERGKVGVGRQGRQRKEGGAADRAS